LALGINYRYEAVSDHFKPLAVGGTKYIDFQHVTPSHVVKANLGWSRGEWRSTLLRIINRKREGSRALLLALVPF